MASSVPATTLASFRNQINVFRGQIYPLQKCAAVSGFNNHQISVTCSTKVSAMAQFIEPQKLKTYVDSFRVRLWEAFPEPVKEIPWKRAEHMLLQRLLFIGEKAMKWSILAFFIVSSLSNVVFAFSRNRELLIPFGLFIGCMMVDFLKETSQELFENAKDVRWHLLGISFFFVLVNVVSVYFTLGARVFLAHFGNGGLMQVLWLWKKSQEESGSSGKETQSSLQDSSIAAT